MAKRKNKNKWLYWLGGLVVVGLVGAGVYFVIKDRTDGFGGEVEDPGISQPVAEDEEKLTAESEEKEKDPEEELEEEKDKNKYEGEDPNKEDELSGVVTYAGVNGKNLTIRVNIDQYLETGTCSLTLSRNNSNIYSDRANIIGVASTATCEGFDIPATKLGEGKIEINIKIKSGEKTGEIRGEVEL